MATGREYLESIIAQCAEMQRWTDAELELFRAELAHVDDRMPSSIGELAERVAEANAAARRTEAADLERMLAPRTWEQRGVDEARSDEGDAEPFCTDCQMFAMHPTHNMTYRVRDTERAG